MKFEIRSAVFIAMIYEFYDIRELKWEQNMIQFKLNEVGLYGTSVIIS